jgi:hypothetical protein
VMRGIGAVRINQNVDVWEDHLRDFKRSMYSKSSIS